MTDVTTHLENQPHGGALKRSEANSLNEQTWQDRHDDRIDRVPAVYKTKHEMLACELALEMEDPEVVFARYGFDPAQGAALMEQPAFDALLARVAKEIHETGLSFRTKARVMAEELLPEAFAMATDPLVSASNRVAIIQWVTKMGALEPPVQKDEKGGNGGGGLNLSITFAGQAPMKVVQNEPITLEAT